MVPRPVAWARMATVDTVAPRLRLAKDTLPSTVMAVEGACSAVGCLCLVQCRLVCGRALHTRTPDFFSPFPFLSGASLPLQQRLPRLARRVGAGKWPGRGLCSEGSAGMFVVAHMLLGGYGRGGVSTKLTTPLCACPCLQAKKSPRAGGSGAGAGAGAGSGGGASKDKHGKGFRDMAYLNKPKYRFEEGEYNPREANEQRAKDAESRLYYSRKARPVAYKYAPSFVCGVVWCCVV